MLKPGETITLDDGDYVVCECKPSELSCMLCEKRNCDMDKKFDAIKASCFALACYEVMGLYCYLKKVPNVCIPSM